MFKVGTLRPIRLAFAIAALGTLGACGEQPTKPADPVANNLLGLFSSGPRLVECQTDESISTEGSIGPLGGILSIGGTSVAIPEGALLDPINVRLTIPASKYVEVEIRAGDYEHFVFELPISVTIDYWRCTRSDVLFKPLSAWYINSQTKALEENMLGIDNKLTRSVTFTTPHLSGYAIAF
jgi:hypothetical protein